MVKNYRQEAMSFLGRRGLVLLTIGLLWILRGASVGYGGGVKNEHNKMVLDAYLPEDVRAFLWVLCGVVAIYFAFRKQDGAGFLFLMAMPLMRALSYLYAFVQYEISDGKYGLSMGLSYFVVWGSVFAVLYICSGWPEPAQNQRELRDRYFVISGEDT